MTAQQFHALSKRLDRAANLMAKIAELETAISISADERWRDKIEFRLTYSRPGYGGESLTLGLMDRDFFRTILASELAATREIFANLKGD